VPLQLFEGLPSLAAVRRIFDRLEELLAQVFRVSVLRPEKLLDQIAPIAEAIVQLSLQRLQIDRLLRGCQR
jgi:hypothetical protein